MPRFFVDPEAVGKSTITVTEGDYNHIRNVLRMRIGEPITVCDGQGTEYACTVESYGERECVLKIEERIASAVELPVAITLCQGLPKKDKMELIIQKAVELGVTCVVPVMCERTIVKLEDPKKEARKVERFGAIAEAAAKQSGRGIVPEVTHPVSWKQAVNDAVGRGDVILVPYENALGMRATVDAFAEAIKASGVSIFIGPEGGLTRDEVAYAESTGAKIISLGRRILRTETAGIAVLSALMLKIEEASEADV
ncbi:MAG: 16S rRNA (uracil(1498)-N(3))-methyltransferase [Lachnospiraceae bacterium]|nr:16S rRNA (uracil(1498)-N(3))-methyltransferase [Lachnospiraceae bacterium]